MNEKNNPSRHSASEENAPTEKAFPTPTEEKGFRRAGRILLKKLPFILAVLLLTAVLLIAYEIAVRLLWQPMFWIYFAALAASLIFYFAYNRGFTRTRVSRNSLPRTWSEEEKDEFYADAERRKTKSRPVLAVIISLFLVFLYDIVALWFGDFLEYVFPFLEMFR